MSAVIIIPEFDRQADGQADDDLLVPEFLKISQEDRRRGWERQPPKSMPAFGRELTEIERLYRQSIEAERRAKRAADEVRFQAMRAKAAARMLLKTAKRRLGLK